ncbi:RHS repeat-associated core domain-containing protein, partial [Streptomyces sp. NPDC003032]
EKVNTYSYSPRGVTRSTSSEKIPQPYQFAGGYQDPTGLYHFSARYYDPNIGRFTQPDPSGQEKNPYLYAEGDPVNRIDPTGLFGISDITETVGSAIGGALGVAATAAVCTAVTPACVAGGAVMAGLGSGSGAAIGSALGGGSPSDRKDAFLGGVLGGILPF